MKKRVLFVASLFLATATFAQDGLTSKKGEAFLPEAGDWAIGFDANPLIGYFGNLANGSTGNNLNLPWFDSTSKVIYGKMFKDENTAYRAKVRIGLGSSSSETTPFDPNTDSSYVNKNKTSNGFTFIVGGGIEKRRGSTRLQGVYGAEALIGIIGGGNTSTTYGKDLSANNTNLGSPRVLKTSNGNTLTFGVNGFIGVEYFIMPKISLAAEYTWGLSFNSTGATNQDTEYWGLTPAEAASANPPSDHLVTESNVTAGKSNSFSFDTANTGSASLTVLFHF